MEFDSLPFIGFCLIAIIALNLFRSGRPRSVVLLALSLVFASSFADSASQLLPLAAFVLAGYLALMLVRTAPSAVFLLLIAAFVLLFAWLKRYSALAFVPALPQGYALVGLSYILFRVLHLLVDVHEGQLSRPHPLDYLAYVFSFLTFVSGPIQRYEDFAAQMAKPRLVGSVVDVQHGLDRLIRGYFLIAVVTKVTYYALTHLEPRLYSLLDSGRFAPTTLLFYSAAVATYTTHLYLNFEGYMCIVIGVGTLCGFALPENFDRPYLSENLLDFWSRWHITLSNWFKYYLFNPSVKLLTVRWGTPAAMPYIGAAGYFATFFVMGIWHGSTWIFFVYGLFLGFGMSVNKLFQVFLPRWRGRAGYRALREAPWYRHLSRGLALGYIMIAQTSLWIPTAEARQLLTARGAIMAISALVLVSLAIAILSATTTSLLALLAREPSTKAASPTPRVSAFLTAAKIYAVANMAFILGGTAPEFVYKVF